jgi:hypothetical protein
VKKPQTGTSAQDIIRIYSQLPEQQKAPPFSTHAAEEADYNARHWLAAGDAPLKPGTVRHKSAVARMFRETFNPYKPSVIDWPNLDSETLLKITSLPIWNIAVETEGKARLRMAAYAATVSDPDMRDAIARNAWEENRHKEVLSKLVEAYGIQLGKETPYVTPRDAEWAYMVTGFSECVDSFFAFGLFELAKRSGFFPSELVETFEPIMQEECRHILLFANWLGWHRAALPAWKRFIFELRIVGVWCFLAYERIGTVKSLDLDGNTREYNNNFTVTSADSFADFDLKFGDFLGLCLEENDRRFSGYDHRLQRPRMIPNLARAIRFFLKSSNILFEKN